MGMSELWAETLREELETGETGSMENQKRAWAEQELGAWCLSGDAEAPGLVAALPAPLGSRGVWRCQHKS